MIVEQSGFLATRNTAAIRVGAWLILAAFGYCMITMLDPAGKGFGLRVTTTGRYFPYIVIFIGLAFLLVGGVSKRLLSDPLFWIPIVLFLAFAAGGVTTALSRGWGLEQTTVGRSLPFVALLAGILVGSQYQASGALAKIALFGVGVGFVSAVLRGLEGLGLAFTSLTQSYHTESFILFGALTSLILIRRNIILKIFVVSVFLISFSFSGKSTSYILLIIGFGTIAVRFILQQAFALKRVGSKGAASILALFLPIGIFCVTISGANTFLTTRLLARPDDARSWLFRARIEQWQDSPIYGSLFIGSPVMETPYLPGVLFPTHNDLLDVAAFGGILTISAYFYVLYRAFNSDWIVEAISGKSNSIVQNFFSFTFVGFLFVMLANPIMYDPIRSIPAYLTIGILAARPNGWNLASR